MDEFYIKKRIEELGLKLSGDNLYVTLIILNDVVSIEQDISEKEKQTIDFSILNIINEILDVNNNGVCFRYSFGHYIIISNNENDDNPKDYFERNIGVKLYEPIKKIFNISLSLGFGNNYN